MVLEDVEGEKYSDYSPTNTGWYKDNLPQQRYVAYVTTWIGVADLLAEGRQDEIDEESLALLAWAPHDTAAYDVATEMMRSERYPGLETIHRKVYGAGNANAVDGYGDIDFPKISRSDIPAYNMAMTKTLEGGIGRMQTGPFHTPGVFEKVATWLTGEIRDAGNLVVPEDMQIEGEVDPLMWNRENQNPTQADVFYTASQYGTPPGSGGMDMRIAAGNIGQFAAEGFMIGQALGLTMTGVRAMTAKVAAQGTGEGARTAAQAAGSGQSLTQSIVQGVNKFKSSPRLQGTRDVARAARWGSAAVSTASLGVILADAKFGNLDQTDLEDNMSPQNREMLQRAQRRYSPIPYKAPPTGTSGDPETAMGQISNAQNRRFSRNAVADAWQDQQNERRNR